MEESQVYLKRGGTNEMVPASLYDEITSEHLKKWEDTWVHAMKVYNARNPSNQRPEDSHWDWKRKIRHAGNLLSFHAYSLICQNELQGLMLCKDLASAKLPGQFGKAMVYVEFLSTAPWNRPQFQQPVEFKGCGRILILAAIEVSKAQGGRGRIGLHSLPDAEEFYEKKCGMTRLGPDAAHQGLVYFEMTETQAEMFCKNQIQ